MLSKSKNPQIPNVYDVDPEEVFRRISELFLVDVRLPEELSGELGHIEGAISIVLNELPEHIHELPTEKPIVFICRSGNRSAFATQFAIENGRDGAYNMRGGMIAWNELNFDIKGKNF